MSADSMALDHAPRFHAAAAARIAAAFRSGIRGAIPLDSERDQNFLVDAGEDSFVLKIANSLEADGVDAQIRALGHIEPRFGRSPRTIARLEGGDTIEVEGESGRRHTAWAVTRMAGVPLSSVRWRSADLFERLGSAAGDLVIAFDGFDHPGLHREFDWDLARGPAVVETLRPLVSDAALGRAVDGVMDRVLRHCVPLFAKLPAATIHNDLNDNNVLVGGGDDPFTRNQHVTGIIDFGDIIHGFRVGDVAIACAYAALDAPDPLAVCASVVRGFHARCPLDENELSVLFGLVALRLCTSVCMAAKQQRDRPGNAYLGISQGPIRRTLPVLAATHFALAEAVLREACGLDPSPRGTRVAAWLRERTHRFAAILDADPRTEAAAIIAMDPESPLMHGDPRMNDERPLTARIDAAMREAGARVGLGLWDEPRLLYDGANAFAAAGGEPRTVHLGIDLFAPAGSPVYAPINGTIHDFGDNAAPGDYGPVILLRHATPDGDTFLTLYGHLARESLRNLDPGRTIAAGQRIGWIGESAVNGGWTPHVHVQVIADDRDIDRAFPGVGRASRREAWRSLCPDPNLIAGVPAERLPSRLPGVAETLATRRAVLGPGLSVGYRTPVRVVRGWKQYLYDDGARRFLDAYNNVPHVGHAHPRVVEAAHRQMSLVATNTRYLNDRLNEYAERLCATMPDPLGVCFFVNSGSEANELAIRLARTCTRARDTIVLEAAYHGNTNVAIDLSPYKHAGPGGAGPPDWVHTAPIPDDYRGPHRRDDPRCGASYAAEVGAVIDRLTGSGRRLSAFIAETCPSVGGQVIPPPGYFMEVYRRVRDAHGLCIADEVQTGFGRMGTHFWAFQAHDVVPDIVVLGKPMGNGYPIGAVVTTRAIADAFDNGMEFFSTFGGNNVAAAAGLAVLDVLRDEGLQDHALEVGQRLDRGLRELMRDHDRIGDVRGSGLFFGAEIVADRDTRRPAPAEASFVVERLRDRAILAGTDGPFHNVIKIRPPMPFDRADADRLIETMASVLRLL